MPDFAKGKIYKIEVDGLTYYGSTATTLKKRMIKHKSGYKRWKNGIGSNYKSFTLFDKYGFDNCQIKLVEDYPCQTKKELLIREDWYIKTMECINEKAAHITKEELREQTRQYYQDHKEDNKEKRNETSRQYRQDHKEEINEKQLQNYHANKEAISEKKKERIVCECGREFRKSYIARHRRTAFHLANI